MGVVEDMKRREALLNSGPSLVELHEEALGLAIKALKADIDKGVTEQCINTHSTTET